MKGFRLQQDNYETNTEFVDSSLLVEKAKLESSQDENGLSADVVTAFFNSIKHFEVCTPEEEAEYARRIQNGDKEARDEFIQRNLKLVFHAAKKRINKSPHEFKDLIAAGCEGLIHAVEKYNPKKARFSTYAMYWICAYMKRSEENSVRTIRLPSYLVQLRTKINNAKESLEKEYGREPTVKELMEETGCLEKEVVLALKSDYRMYSLNNEFGDEKENEGITFFAAEENVEEKAINNILTEKIVTEVRSLIRNNLSDNEQKVIIMRHFNQYTFEAIGDALGVTKQRVRDIERKAMAILKQCGMEKGLHKLIYS